MFLKIQKPKNLKWKDNLKPWEHQGFFVGAGQALRNAQRAFCAAKRILSPQTHGKTYSNIKVGVKGRS